MTAATKDLLERTTVAVAWLGRCRSRRGRSGGRRNRGRSGLGWRSRRRTLQVLAIPVPTLSALRCWLLITRIVRYAALLPRMPVPTIGRTLGVFRRSRRVGLTAPFDATVSILEASS